MPAVQLVRKVLSLPDPSTGLPLLLSMDLRPHLADRFDIYLDRMTVPGVAGLPLLLGVPADRRFLHGPQTQLWPSVEHTMCVCYVCDQMMWIGPRQRNVDGIRICGYCVELRSTIFAAAGRDDGSSKVRVLNDFESEIRHRKDVN